MSRNEADELRLVTVTFILAAGRLLTLRHGDPTPFRTFVAHAEKEPGLIESGETAMAGLLEAIVARAAELLGGVATSWRPSRPTSSGAATPGRSASGTCGR